jgi:polyisoprenoid-binding protein YceI
MSNTWILDPTHSELLFKIKHMMISYVQGEFRSFNVSIETKNEDNFHDAIVKAVIDTTSIFTNHTERDAHLRSADFFETEKYPEIQFEANDLLELDEHHFRLRGPLTMKGITNDVRVEVEFGGIQLDPWGNTRAGFSLQGTLNRKDWNITWNSPIDNLNFILGNEITFTAELQFVKQKSE